jgi:hypothetical protein
VEWSLIKGMSEGGWRADFANACSVAEILQENFKGIKEI